MRLHRLEDCSIVASVSNCIAESIFPRFFIVGRTGTSSSQRVTSKQASELTTGLGQQHMHDCDAIAQLADRAWDGRKDVW